MTEIDELLAHARRHSGELAVPEMSSRPARRVAIVACMDVRLDLHMMFGYRRGEAHTIRNAGGLVTDDVLRSLSASQRLLGTEEVLVVMHDGCGLNGASDADFDALLRADGAEPGFALGGFASVEDELRGGLARLRAAPELPRRDQIRGVVIDPGTGEVREVE